MFFTNSINKVVSNKKKTRNLIKNINRLQTYIFKLFQHTFAMLSIHFKSMNFAF